MFIQLANALKQQQTGSATTDVSYDLFRFHPIQLQTAMDVLWEYARRRTSPPVAVQINDPGIGGPVLPPTPAHPNSLRDELLRVLHNNAGGLEVNALAQAVAKMLDNIDAEVATPGQSQDKPPRLWHHLIYAYLIENTRVVNIFAKVLHEIVHGERLGAISAEGHQWARTTEELFFRQQGFSFISSIESSIRPDPAATRRNAYYRMFAMDLNHGTVDNGPYPYIKAEASNQEFVTTLESFLAEIWRGYINATNTSGVNTTDDSEIADLAQKLQEMLNERRIQGNLTREEFVAVSTAAWFHLALASPDSPIIFDLKANGITPEERLRRVAERVGLAPHSKSRSLFLLAEPLSALLVEIERGTYSSATNVRALYDPNVTDNVAKDTLAIVSYWGAATGRNLKAVPVTGAR